MAEQLRQLVYLSRALRPFSTSDLRALQDASEERNRFSDVGGALLYGCGMFLQALEGESDAVDKVYQRIQKDPRHTDLRALVDHRIGHRAFRVWAMTTVALDDGAKWSPEHAAAVDRMAGVATVAPPGSAAHSLLGSFAKHVRRIAA